MSTIKSSDKPADRAALGVPDAVSNRVEYSEAIQALNAYVMGLETKAADWQALVANQRATIASHEAEIARLNAELARLKGAEPC